MYLALICVLSLFASALTFFSGFGLGTILVPVFALFFPIEQAVALTACVHFLNSLFKLALVGKHANAPVVLRFGIPSLFASLVGAFLLTVLTNTEPMYTYTLHGTLHNVTTVKAVIAILLFIFALFDIVPALASLHFDRKYLVVGGLLSGFFGGLSGNQGALRAAFLNRAGLTKEGFVASGVVIACMIDVSRLSVYSQKIVQADTLANYPIMIAATFSAFLGAFLGNKFLKKITLRSLHYFVSIALLVFSILLGTGIL